VVGDAEARLLRRNDVVGDPVLNGEDHQDEQKADVPAAHRQFPSDASAIGRLPHLPAGNELYAAIRGHSFVSAGSIGLLQAKNPVRRMFSFQR
jgi:hypothetical protein